MSQRTDYGVGIITCDRPEFLRQCLKSLPEEIGNTIPLVIVNDGKKILDIDLFDNRKTNLEIINHETNKGVGISKNDALKALLRKQIDHIFLLEDDILILKPETFSEYIKASQTSGILHFNYGPGSPFNRKQDFQFDLHNRHLCKQDSEVNPKKVIEYPNGVKIALYEHTVAMFSYFHRQVLEEVGLHDEQFYNAWEHVDLTYRIIKAGYHPPFWWFADIADSDKYLTEAPSAIDNSSIAKDTKQWEKNVYGGRDKYLAKHGHYPNQPPIASTEFVVQNLTILKRRQKLLELEKEGKVKTDIGPGSQVEEEFEALLKIYKKLNPKNACEIGSLLGWTMKRFINASSPGTNIVSVDLPVRFFTGSQDERVNQQEFGHNILWKRWAAEKQVNLHVLPFSSFDQYTSGMVRSITPELDFLFIDGNHMYQAIKHDFETYGKLVRKGGVIAFHDIALNEEGGGHIFWNEIKSRYEYKEILKSPEGKMGIGAIIV
jgi:glycosyltransferase involved in cell wall biosynthesis